MENATQFIFQILIILFSVIIHEVSHGYAALMLGDKTAQYAERLTLNPVKHIDPFGSILLPVMLALMHAPIIGWAKPVPFNPYNLRNQKWGPAIVGAAGPLANMALALIFGFVVRGFANLPSETATPFFINFVTIASIISILNLFLALFNLIPIPPLDGSKVLFALLPYHWRSAQWFLERYGIFVILIFIVFLSPVLRNTAFFLFRLISGTLPFI